MLEIKEWNKEQVYAVMQELLYSFNYAWFLMEGWIRQNCPEKADTESFHQIAETFGSYEAKRLEKTIDPGITGIGRLIAFLKHSHWCAFEDIELKKLSDRQLRMRTRDCTAQKAAQKWGEAHYDCSRTGLRLRKGFFSRLHPGTTVERVFTPPDPRPEQTPSPVSCEWIITLPES